MCGIAGLVKWRQRPDAADAAAVLAMLDAESHRGPDDWGLLIPRSLGDVAADPFGDREHVRAYDDDRGPLRAILGARRLSILDPSSRGRMPMADPSGRVFIVHNGEVYNHADLRRELTSGDSPFSSGTDTEVMLRAHARFGDDAIARLHGMFAYALLDTRGASARVLLVRDRLGIKPLYYYEDAERLVWASEVRALLASGLVPDVAEPEALVRYLQLGSVPAPLTTVRGVRALGPGEWLSITEDGLTRHRYWSLAAVERERALDGASSRAEIVVATRALLDDVVERHLTADVPVGVFLSGGIDSSALVALAAPHRRPLVTLSLDASGDAQSEAPIARLVAERFGTAHQTVEIGDLGLDAAMPAFFRAMDEPTIDGLNTYVMGAAARRHGVPVILSGTGGDEVFWGYRHLRRARAYERVGDVVAALPGPARTGLARAVAGGGRAIRHGGALDRLAYWDRPSPTSLYLTVRGLFGPADVRRLLGTARDDLDAPAFASDRPSLARLEFEHYLPNQLLKDADVMGMAHAVEIRVPFLDHRLVEHVATVPPEMLRARRTPKPLLLAALGEALPRAVWDRPKAGFTLPFAPWMRRHARALRDETRAGAGLDPRAVDRVWDGFDTGRTHWSRPWALVALARRTAARRAA